MTFLQKHFILKNLRKKQARIESTLSTHVVALHRGLLSKEGYDSLTKELIKRYFQNERAITGIHKQYRTQRCKTEMDD
jgi:hypothetical protein